MITLVYRLELLVTVTIFTLPAILSGCNNVQGMPAFAPSTTINAATDDSLLTTKIKTALMESGDINSFDMKIQTQKDEIVLSGFADSQAQIDLNIAVVRRVEGVGKVINHISIRRFT